MMEGPLSAPSSPPLTPTPKKWMALLLEGFLPSLSIGPKGIPSIDENVARIKERH